MKNKIGQNDPCWCGSGEKYKKCHLNREQERPPLFKTIEHEVRKNWKKKKICFHPLAMRGVCDKIISSHTVQKSKVLKEIIDFSGHVGTFYPHTRDELGELVVQSVGWNVASTFNGFCAKHDDLAFKPIEKTLFTGTSEQCFLVGYRALCHEVYQKQNAVDALSFMRHQIDKGCSIDEQIMRQREFRIRESGVQKGLNDYETLKAIMDQDLIREEYDNWASVIIFFNGPLCIASTGLVSATHTIEGKQLFALHDFSVSNEGLLYGIVSIPNGGAVVLTWSKKNSAPLKLVDSILKIDRYILPSIIVQFMFAYVENTYFSFDWWNGKLPHDIQQHLKNLAAIVNPYYSNSIQYLRDPFVQWMIKDVIKINC